MQEGHLEGQGHWVVQVPCLVSRVDETAKRQATRQRKTQHTVEAISLDGSRTWIGINQCFVGRCVSHALSFCTIN